MGRKANATNYQILVSGIVVHETTNKWAHRMRKAEMKAKGMVFTTNKIRIKAEF